MAEANVKDIIRDIYLGFIIYKGKCITWDMKTKVNYPT